MNNKIQFVNKVWVAAKGKKIDRILWWLCWIYLALNIIPLVLEGINAISIFMIVFVIIVLFILRKRIKTSGKYIESLCFIEFTKEKIIWEYPAIDLLDGKGNRHLIYEIYNDHIFNIARSIPLNSIRIGCEPLAISQFASGKVETLDCRDNMKEVVLHTYNYNSEELQALFEEYTSISVVNLD